MLIFGSRSTNRLVGYSVWSCQACGRMAVMGLFEKESKFTLYFVPVLTTAKDVIAMCGVCGSPQMAWDPQRAVVATEWEAREWLARTDPDFAPSLPSPRDPLLPPPPPDVSVPRRTLPPGEGSLGVWQVAQERHGFPRGAVVTVALDGGQLHIAWGTWALDLDASSVAASCTEGMLSIHAKSKWIVLLPLDDQDPCEVASILW